MSSSSEVRIRLISKDIPFYARPPDSWDDPPASLMMAHYLNKFRQVANDGGAFPVCPGPAGFSPIRYGILYEHLNLLRVVLAVALIQRD